MRNELQAGALAGARFVDPVVLARVGNLELVARSVVEGFINGMHRSAHFGASVDFAEHRGYTPGDDIRRVDWKLFGRTDRFYIKEYEADTNANFACLLDVSKSMAFGSRGITKLDYGRILAACLTYMVHRQRDRVGFAAFDDDIVEYVPPSAKHMETTLHILDRLKPAKPGQLAFASPGPGTSPHLAGELLKTLTHVDLTHVPYKGSGPALSDVIGGQVPIIIDTTIVLGAQIKAGKLRPLAVAYPKRLGTLPDVLTAAEAGVPGWEVVSWQAVFAPAGTPKPIVQRLNTEIAGIMKMPDVQARLAELGVEVGGGPPEQLAEFQKTEIAKWAKVVKAAGVKPE